MPRTEFYQIYAYADEDDLINQINFILNQISNRIDQLEGIRGTTTIQDGVTIKSDGAILHGINTESEDDANN